MLLTPVRFTPSVNKPVPLTAANCVKRPPLTEYSPRSLWPKIGSFVNNCSNEIPVVCCEEPNETVSDSKVPTSPGSSRLVGPLTPRPCTPCESVPPERLSETSTP